MPPDTLSRTDSLPYPLVSISRPDIGSGADRSLFEDARLACERALDPLDPRKEGPARLVVQSTLAASGAHLFVHLPSALDGDVEGVHQARVAIRRHRTALRTFRPLLDRDRADQLRRQLLWMADDLGAVRDADVMIELLDAGLAQLGEPDGGATLIGLVEQERQRARGKLLEDTAGQGTERLVKALVRVAEDPPTNRRAESPARKRLIRLVAAGWQRLESAVEEVGKSPTQDELHRIRILAKRARYATEAVAPAFGGKATRLGIAVSEMQDALGELHDAAVACSWLTDTAVRLDPRAAFTAGRLHGWISERGAGDAERWRDRFGGARRRYDEWLG